MSGIRKFDIKMDNRTVEEIESDMISMHFGKSFEIVNEIEKIIKIFIKSFKKILEEAKINKEHNIEKPVKKKFLNLILFSISIM